MLCRGLIVNYYPSCKSAHGRTPGTRMFAVRKKHRRGCAKLRDLASFLFRISCSKAPSSQRICARPFPPTSVCNAFIRPLSKLDVTFGVARAGANTCGPSNVTRTAGRSGSSSRPCMSAPTYVLLSHAKGLSIPASSQGRRLVGRHVPSPRVHRQGHSRRSLAPVLTSPTFCRHPGVAVGRHP
jgi:hypothetical protein